MRKDVPDYGGFESWVIHIPPTQKASEAIRRFFVHKNVITNSEDFPMGNLFENDRPTCNEFRGHSKCEKKCINGNCPALGASLSFCVAKREYGKPLPEFSVKAERGAEIAASAAA